MFTEEKVLKYRHKHPNCLYCQHLAKDRYIMYYCKEKNKTFLFGNRIKACRCPMYEPQKDDLKVAAATYNKAEELGVIKFDI